MSTNANNEQTRDKQEMMADLSNGQPNAAAGGVTRDNTSRETELADEQLDEAAGGAESKKLTTREATSPAKGSGVEEQIELYEFDV
jgi:hypothetical protein